MLARTFRSVVTGVAVIALAACGGDDNNAPPAADPVVGNWALASMNGIVLPVQITYQNGVVFIVTSGTALAADGGTFTATYNGSVDGTAAALQVNGTWARNGANYLIAGNGSLNGISVGAVNSTGTLSGSALIIDGVERWVKQ